MPNLCLHAASRLVIFPGWLTYTSKVVLIRGSKPPLIPVGYEPLLVYDAKWLKALDPPTYGYCSGQQIPDSKLSWSSALAGGIPAFAA